MSRAFLIKPPYPSLCPSFPFPPSTALLPSSNLSLLKTHNMLATQYATDISTASYGVGIGRGFSLSCTPSGQFVTRHVQESYRARGTTQKLSYNAGEYEYDNTRYSGAFAVSFENGRSIPTSNPRRPRPRTAQHLGRRHGTRGLNLIFYLEAESSRPSTFSV